MACEKTPGIFFLEASQVGKGFADPNVNKNINYTKADGSLMGKKGNYRKDKSDFGSDKNYFDAMHTKTSFYKFASFDE